MSEQFDYLDSTIDRLQPQTILQAPLLNAAVKEQIQKPAAPIYSDLDEIINQTVKERDDLSVLNRSISTGVQQNPDNFAKIVDLSERAGIDPVTLQANPEILKEAERNKNLASIDIDKLYKQTPKTAEFVSDPTNASVAHDDIDNLSEIEQDYKSMLNTLYTFTLKPIAKVGSGALIKGPANLFGLAAASIGKIAEDMRSTPKPYSEMTDDELIKLRQEEGFGGPGRTASARTMSTIGHWLGLGEPLSKVENYLLGQQRALNKYGDRLSGTTGKEGYWESSIMSGFESLGLMAPVLAYGKATGDWKGLLTVMSLQTLGSTYGEDRSKNISAAVAQEHAFKDFVAEFATELIPVKYLMTDGIFKTNVLKNMVNYQWREGTTEQVATLWQDFNKWSMTEPDKPVIEFLKERPSAALSTAIATTIAGGGQIAAVKAADSLLNRESTLNTKAYFDALANGITNSKLQQRLPEKMKQFVAKVKEQGDVKDVFINAERFANYFQENGVDPKIPANELLGKDGAKALEDAIAKGGDLVIPLETYASQVAGTPYHDGLVDDLRLRQGDESARDVAAYKKKEEETKVDIEALVAKTRTDNVGNLQVKQIYDDLYNEALGAGVPPSQADTWAILESDRYRARAERLEGEVDPLQLYHNEGAIQISRPGAAVMPTSTGEEVTLNQFAGQKAETAHIESFNEAQKRINTGEDPTTVRLDTGWFLGADNQWRFEIRDFNARLTPLVDKVKETGKTDKTAQLDQVLHHPTLFKAYPFLKTVKVGFDLEGDSIGYSTKGEIKIGMNTPDPLSTLLHEIQHSVQRFEGFAVGGSPEQMIGEKLSDERNQQMESLKKDLFTTMKEKGDVMPIRKRMAMLFFENSYDAYRRLHGEQEARDVQERQKMSVDELKEIPPKTMTTTDAIVVFDNRLDANIAFSVKDIKQLMDVAPGDQLYSLDKFADQFQTLIKQKDKTIEDVNRIAKSVIDNVKSDPGKVLPVATGDTISYEQYLMMPDGTTYDPNKLEHSNASDLTVDIYKAVKDGTIKQALKQEAENLNESRRKDLGVLAYYLDGNEDYTSAEQAMILDGARKWGYTTEQKDKNIEVKMVAITAKNRTAIPVVDGITASLVAEQLRKGLGIKEAMLHGITNLISKRSENADKTRNGWVNFEKSDTEEAAVELNKACAAREWCTAGSESTARDQRSKGDFWVYFVDGEAKIAVRTEDGKLGEAPRGSLPGQKLTDEEAEIASDFLKKSSIKGGSEFVEDQEYIKGILDNSIDDQTLFLRGLKPERLADNGHNNDNRKFNKAFLDRVKDIYTERGEALRGWENGGYFTLLPDGIYKHLREKVVVLKGNIDASLSKVSLPNARIVGNILANEAEIYLPKATTVGNIYANEVEAKIFIPNATTVGNIYKNKAEVSLPNVTVAGNIKSNKDDVSLPSAEIVGNIYDNKAEVSLPKATNVGEISYNEAEVSLPNAVTVGNIRGNNAEVSLPNAKTVGEIIGNKGKVFLPSVTNVGPTRNNREIYAPLIGRILEQNESSQEPPLGFASFAPGIRRITLNPKANLTTMIHELGHTWIEELQRDATGARSTPQLKDDWKILMDYTGMNEPDMLIPTEAHEKIARSIESYFTEGKAPSVGLRRVFHKVKAWMLSVYESLEFFNRSYGTNLNQNVKDTFDRMLALDAEIAQARMLNGYIQMFSDPEQAAMTEAEFKAYSAATTDSIRDQEEKLIAKVATHLARQQTVEWRSNRKAITKESEEHALTLKEYAAINTLSKGLIIVGAIEPIKLSKEGIIELIGKDGLSSVSPRKLQFKDAIYQDTGGMHPDTAAKELGYRSGTAMLQQFAAAEPFKEYVNKLTDATMKERYGDPLDPGELRLAAEEEVHSTRQAELLNIELKALKRKQAEVEKITRPIKAEARKEESKQRALLDAKIPLAIIKDIAYEEISNLKVQDIKPHGYLLAEVRAGTKALDLASKKKYAEAAEAKQQQILNFHLYREALKGEQEGKDRIRAAYKLTSKSAQSKLGLAGQEWLEQVNGILGDYSFATLPTTLRARRIVDFARAIEEDTGEIIALAPSVIEEGKKQNYKELTLDELRAVSDSLESLKHVAFKLYTVDVAGKKRELNRVAEELAASATSHMPLNTLPLVGNEVDLTAGQRLSVKTKDLINTLWRPEKIFERLDAGTEGIWHDMFWNPSVQAQVKADDLKEKVLNPVVKLLEGQSDQLDKRMNEVLDIESLDKTMTRRTAIGVALNLGNDSNRMKLQNGGMWFGLEHKQLTDEAIEEIKDKLTEEDWAIVQGLWDAVNLLSTELNDLNKRVTGLPLKMIEPTPVLTKFGTLKGGYWPAVGDPRHTKVGEIQENATGDSLSTLFPPKYPKAATSHSFREERTRATYPLQLDWKRVFSTHINNAIKDIAYHEWIKQSRRLLDKTAVKKTLQNTIGEQAYRSLHDWLVHQVMPIHGGYASTQSVDNVQNGLLSNIAVAALGFKLSTVIGNMMVAPVQASHQIKSRYMIKGLAEYVKNPMLATRKVHSMSGEMKHRFEHYDQTFNTTIEDLSGNHSFRANVGRMAMAIHLYADRVTSTALWLGKYEQEMDNMPDTERASQLADKMIRTTQTAGAPKDLSAFERDPRYKIFKMFLGPMLIMHNEQRGAVGKAGGIKGALTDPKAWGVMFATWIIPSMLFEFAVGRGPDDDDDWEDWALRKVLLYQAQQMPFIRDAGSAVEGALTGFSPGGRSNPLSDVMINVVKQSNKLFDEDTDLKELTVAVTRMIGPLTGLPSNAAIPVEEYLFDTSEEGLQNPYRLVYRKPKEQR